MDTAEPEILNCSRCHHRGSRVAFDVPEAGPFPKRVLCYQCRFKIPRNPKIASPWQWWIPSLGFGLLGAGLVIGTRDHFPGWMFIGLAIIGVLSFPSVMLHEAGHWLGARIGGMQVPMVSIGRGRRFAHFSLFGTWIEFRAMPSGGSTVATTEKPERLRRRKLVMTICGPLANLLTASAVACTGLLLQPDVNSLLRCTLCVFFGLNAFMAAGNLLPFVIRGSMGSIPTDGLAILVIPFCNDKTKRAWIEGHFTVGWRVNTAKGDHAAAAALAARGEAQFPDAWMIRNQHAISLMGQGCFVDARHRLDSLLDRTDLSIPQRLMLKNNLAYCLYLEGDAKSLAFADVLSAEAEEILPSVATYAATRGAVLLACGRTQEAETMLLRALGSTDDETTLGEAAAVLAEIMIGKGEATKARRYQRIAVKADASNRRLPALASKLVAMA